MAIPDPEINAEFRTLADRFAAGELDKAAFDKACTDMLVRHHILLPEPQDIEADHEPQR